MDANHELKETFSVRENVIYCCSKCSSGVPPNYYELDIEDGKGTCPNCKHEWDLM
jgi:DNA-directed RNA polymerase subunit RPC12/RpoP